MSYHQAGKGPWDWKVPFVSSLTKYSWGQVHFMSNTNKYVDLDQVGNSGSDKGLHSTWLLLRNTWHVFWVTEMACTSTMYTVYTVLLLTYSCLNPVWDVYNEINIVIADGVNLFPMEDLDGRKWLALVLWAIFLSSQAVGPLIYYHSYIHITLKTLKLG